MSKLLFLTALAIIALMPLTSWAQGPDAVSYSRSFSSGVEEYDKGHYEEALDSFLRAVQANPEDADAVFNTGLTYEKLERPIEASVAFRRALELRPDYHKARTRLCPALVNSERFWDAVEACGRAIRQDPKDATLYFEYGRAFAGAGLYDQAVEALMRAVRLRPDWPEAHLRLGLAYRALGEYDEALDSLARAARLAPDAMEPRRALEDLNAEIADLDRALAPLEGRDRLLSLGHAYRAKGWYRRAALVYRRAASLRPAGDAEASYYEGLAYFGMNQYYRAAACYRRAVKLDPNLSKARRNLEWLSGYLKSREGLETALSPAR